MTGDRKFGILMLTCVMASIGAGGGAVLASDKMANDGRRETERKFCALAATGRETEARKLTGYDKEPPLTEAGRSQRDQVAASLAAYRNLEHSLGCPTEKKE